MNTLEQILQKIHRAYEGDTDYPESTEEDYALRLGLINDSIDKWAYNEEGMRWNELFVNLADAADGDKTTEASTGVYDAPTNFVEISSYLKITSSTGSLYYPFAKADEVINHLRDNSNKKFFYVTGKPGAYKININPAYDSAGDTISYSYYKQPTHLANASDKPEMSKPQFIVYDVLATLYELDNRNDLLQKYMQLARNAMEGMVIANEVPPFLADSSLDDVNWKTSGVAFGR